jgi:predicted nucleic acid-binding protein
MSYLLDTNIVSELRKGPRANPGVVSWIAAVEDTQLYLSVLVVGELRRGVELCRRRDPRSATALEQWLDELLRLHGGRVLGIDRSVAEAWARLGVPDPVPVVDGLLAATAIIHGLTLVTRNVADVRRTGVRVLNPFSDV